MRRFDLHQDKAEKKSKDLFFQMVVVQAVTLLVSGLVLGLFFSLMFFLMSERCLLYTSPSPRDRTRSRMPSSA